MSQLVAAAGNGFVVIAADRRVETRGDDGVSVRFTKKLYPLGRYAAIATGGAAVGINISLKLATLLGESRKMPFNELESYAIGVFQHEYDSFLRQGEEWFKTHPEAIRRAFILLAGSDGPNAPAIRFYASEDHGEPFRSLPVGNVLTAPRRLGLESALSRALMKGAAEEEIRGLVVESLARIEKADEAVGGPFDILTIFNDGIKTDAADFS